MKNPWEDRRKNKEHGRKAESRAAKRLKAREHAGSGNLGVKADMTLGTIKIESKATKHRTMKLDLAWLLKVSQEALEVGQTPALIIQFVNGDGAPVKNGSWVMIQEDKFRGIAGEVSKADN